MSGMSNKRKASRAVAKQALDAARVLIPNGEEQAVDDLAMVLASTVIGERIDRKDIDSAKQIGTDRSDKPRRFEVWVDRNAVGLEMISEVVDVAPGEDANAICSDVLETLMSNEIDSGWQEVRP